MNNIYNQVYNFTNENVSCLNEIYNFENSKVLTVVGSGDHFFASILNGAKKVDLFDKNPTSYLYFVLKFYSIRELTYEEFYDFLVLRNLCNKHVYNKLECVLPVEVLKYYRYLINTQIKNKRKNPNFRSDGIDLFSKKNQKYYFNKSFTIIPYFSKDNYYKLQECLKNIKLPEFLNCDIRNLKEGKKDNYDIMLMSNIYDHISVDLLEYTKLLGDLDTPEIQACYDWYGFYLDDFIKNNYHVNMVSPSSPSQYNRTANYIYSLKK